jgi:hypothetical protein
MGEFAALRGVAHDRRRIVREHPRGRHVADAAAHGPGNVADGLRAFGDIEVVHGQPVLAIARTSSVSRFRTTGSGML